MQEQLKIKKLIFNMSHLFQTLTKMYTEYEISQKQTQQPDKIKQIFDKLVNNNNETMEFVWNELHKLYQKNPIQKLCDITKSNYNDFINTLSKDEKNTLDVFSAVTQYETMQETKEIETLNNVLIYLFFLNSNEYLTNQESDKPENIYSLAQSWTKKAVNSPQTRDSHRSILHHLIKVIYSVEINSYVIFRTFVTSNRDDFLFSYKGQTRKVLEFLRLNYQKYDEEFQDILKQYFKTTEQSESQ